MLRPPAPSPPPPVLTHFSAADQFIKGAERVRNWSFGVGLMQLIEIDPVGPKSPQTRFDRFTNIFWWCAPLAFPHFHAELRCDDDLIASPFERPAKELFA